MRLFSSSPEMMCVIKYISDPIIVGDMFLKDIHMGSLQVYIKARQKQGRKTRTINHGLKVIRHLLNLAASEWIDESGLTWLESAPKIKLLPEYDNRAPYPLSWEEEDRLMAALPPHLKMMALYALNTGSRDKEVYELRWAWEKKIEGTNKSIFVIPSHREVDEGKRVRLIKNGQETVSLLRTPSYE